MPIWVMLIIIKTNHNRLGFITKKHYNLTLIIPAHIMGWEDCIISKNNTKTLSKNIKKPFK